MGDNKKVFDARWKILTVALRDETSVALSGGTKVPILTLNNGTATPSKFKVCVRKGSRWYLSGSYGSGAVGSQMTVDTLSVWSYTSSTYLLRYYIFGQVIGEV